MSKKFFLGAFFLNLAFGTNSVALFAHHGNAGFDTSKKVTLKGTVTRWTWSNPHCFIRLDAKDESGNVVHWLAEAENPAYLVSKGWTPRDVEVGQQITLVVTPNKNGTPLGRVWLIILPNGKQLNSSATDPPAVTNTN
jgi:hypothetical protein